MLARSADSRATDRWNIRPGSELTGLVSLLEVTDCIPNTLIYLTSQRTVFRSSSTGCPPSRDGTDSELTAKPVHCGTYFLMTIQSALAVFQVCKENTALRRREGLIPLSPRQQSSAGERRTAKWQESDSNIRAT